MSRVLALLAFVVVACGCLGGADVETTTTVRVSPTTLSLPPAPMSTVDAYLGETTSTVRKAATTTSTIVRTCPRFYSGYQGGCCLDGNNNGVCDFFEVSTTTTTTTTLDVFKKLFQRIANRTVDEPVTNDTQINRNEPVTTTTLYGNFTQAYDNRYDFGDTKNVDTWHRFMNKSGCIAVREGMETKVYCNASYGMT
jgi:hypothetical protein